MDVACGSRALASWRTRACEDLFGEVIEIGFGTGRNIAFYPSTVRTVAAVEPSLESIRIARPRMATTKVKIVHVGLDGQSLDLEDERCDGALCTFTLCTVPDPNLVLREVSRVLRPGATLHFLEHGIAPASSVERWQWRLDPIQRRVAGGCRLTRDPVTMIEQAGFDVDVLDQRYAPGPKPWAYFTLGRATKR